MEQEDYVKGMHKNCRVIYVPKNHEQLELVKNIPKNVEELPRLAWTGNLTGYMDIVGEEFYYQWRADNGELVCTPARTLEKTLRGVQSTTRPPQVNTPAYNVNTPLLRTASIPMTSTITGTDLRRLLAESSEEKLDVLPGPTFDISLDASAQRLSTTLENLYDDLNRLLNEKTVEARNSVNLMLGIQASQNESGGILYNRTSRDAVGNEGVMTMMPRRQRGRRSSRTMNGPCPPLVSESESEYSDDEEDLNTNTEN